MIKYNLKWFLNRQAKKYEKQRNDIAFLGILLMELMLFIGLIK